MKTLEKIKKIICRNNIGEPPWEYDFLVNLDEGLYPLYLKKIFKYKTGEDLPIKKVGKDKWIIDKNKCKTFNQKIQWVKLHGVTDLMRMCTDKVAVRDYVDEKIGSEYLKPVLQICDTFDEIDFEKLPNAFVIKCNHGCKWQYIIKNKDDFLKTPKLVDIVKKQMTGWLEQEYWCWGGFEMQYKGIEPKILIEPLMRDEINTEPDKINVYCFNGKPKIFIKFFNQNKMSMWNENFEPIDNIFNFSEENIKTSINDYINQTYDLSIKLSKDFKFVRGDWFIFQNKIYFEELTYTTYSGFIKFNGIKENLRLGSIIESGEDSR